MHKSLIFSFLAALVVLFFACENKFIFEKKQAVAGDQWLYADSLRYEFDLADTSKIYNLFVDFDHTTAFPNENIYVKITTHFPSGKRLEKQRSFLLADATGQWLGERSGNSFHVRVPLQEGAFFDETGHYSLVFEQWMRQDSLAGIQSIGLAVEKTKENRPATRPHSSKKK